jgi:hypothetical protein
LVCYASTEQLKLERKLESFDATRLTLDAKPPAFPLKKRRVWSVLL